MLERNILIIDDDEDTEIISINAYKDIFRVLKEKEKLNYNLNFFWESSIPDALDRLNKKEEVFDILVIDYDFPNDYLSQKGIDLVKRIREAINKRCKIVFYTMHAPHEINQSVFIELINNDIYRFVPKDGDMLDLKYFETNNNKSDQLIVEAIIDAISDSDPISQALEKYMVEYKEILNKVKINVDGKDCTIEEVLESVRLYGDLGNKFVSNLLQMSIIDHFDIE